MTYDEMYIELVQEFPELKIVPKSASRLMSFVNTLLLILSFGQQQHFLVAYTTTIGDNIYVPADWDGYDDRSKVAILRHERVHLRQQRRLGLFWFGFLYLFAFFPIGFAYFRMRFEQEAYAESMLAYAEHYGWPALTNTDYRASIIAHFTTAQYLWMWPWKKSVDVWYRETYLDIRLQLLKHKQLKEPLGD